MNVVVAKKAKDDENGAGLREPLLPSSDGRSTAGTTTTVAGNLDDEDNASSAAVDRAPSTSTSPPPLPPLPSLGRLVALGRPEFPMLLVAVAFMIFSQVAQLINPKLIGQAYDALVDPNLNDKVSVINRVMGTVLVIHVAGVLAAFIRGSIMGAAGERIVARLRCTVYEKILSQEIAFFDETKSGELVSRLGSDTTVVKQAISQSWAEVAIGAIRLFAAISLMVWISPRLAGVTVGSTAIIFVLSVPFGRALGNLSRSYQDVLGEAQNYPTEAIGAMRTVQAFAAEGRELHKYRDKIGTASESCCTGWWPTKEPKTTYRVGFVRSIVSTGFHTFIFGFGFVAMYCSLWYGLRLVNAGTMTLGELTAFQSYIFQIGASLASTTRNISQVLEAKGASARIFAILDRVPKIPSGAVVPDNNVEEDGPADDDVETGGSPLPDPPVPVAAAASAVAAPTKGRIEFKGVTFAYPSRPNVPVLKDFSLEIPENTTVALVGASGAGKSTVVSLLQRFYEARTGSVFVDGTDIRSMDLTKLRQSMGYVQQEPQLFGITVRDNVAYGMDRVVSDEEIYEACRKANAYDFVAAWPDGLDTMVGERGVKLSGGQKQRIAISRAILLDPRILLLDEATSALDAESEHLVQSAIDSASRGRTVLIVAHRLSTIQRADKIVVLENSTICDTGTHEELMGRCGTYQNLIQRQSFR